MVKWDRAAGEKATMRRIIGYYRAVAMTMRTSRVAHAGLRVYDDGVS
jgi:hypothetical protein